MPDLSQERQLSGGSPSVVPVGGHYEARLNRAPKEEELAGRKRILYVQYTNPAAYPPLLHSARIFADAGWDIRFFGTESFGSRSLELSDSRMRIEKLSYPGASRSLQIHYFRFCLLFVWRVLRWRPSCIYASDLFSYLPALAAHLLTGTPVILHEHDSPIERSGFFYRLLFRVRKALAQRTLANVVPNQWRAQVFEQDTGALATVVFNCPGIHEVCAWDHPDSFVLYYHGTINSMLLPMSLVEALSRLPGDVVLRIVGYETKGSLGYSEKVMERAKSLGVADRVVILPPVSRTELLALCGKSDLGVALFPEASKPADSFSGASNKVFDYLACGLPLLVSNYREWADLLAGMNVARGCNPSDPESIAEAVRWFYDHRDEARLMGREGRQRILLDWNYETQFTPVLEVIGRACGCSVIERFRAS